MTDMAYNTWLLNFHNRINGCVNNFNTIRDQRPYNLYHDLKESQYFIKPIILCEIPELFIFKNRLINRNPLIVPSKKACELCLLLKPKLF